MVQALIFVIETVINLFVLAVLTRFYAQALRAPFRAKAGNPIVDFVVALTDFQKLNVADFESLENLYLTLAESLADQLNLSAIPSESFDPRLIWDPVKERNG